MYYIRVYEPKFIDLVRCAFYPAALKCCQGIVFTHGGQVGGGIKVCPGCISETVRCRKLILSRDIG